MLAVAVTAAYLISYRRPPWRIAAVSTAILGPWLVFSTFYFGSPLPNSFTQKVSGEVTNPALAFDRGWILDSLRNQRAMGLMILAVAAVAVVPYVLRRNRPAAVALIAAVIWPLAHLVVFSVMDLGDAYPWYLTVLYPPLALAAGCTLGTVFQLARERSATMAVVALAALVGTAPLALGLGSNDLGMVDDVPRALRTTPTTNEYLQFELARRTAGARVAELAEPDDVIATCFGWIAFEAIENTIDEVCPLNTRKETPDPRWYVTITYPGTEPPPRTEGWEIVETVVADNEIGGRADIIRVG